MKGLEHHQQTERVLIRLYADLPTKKNQIRAGRGGGHYPANVKATIDNMTLQARMQWGAREPVEHPDIEVYFFVHNLAKDRDGLWTTTVDCLKKAGVIVDDSIRRYNGRELKHPAVPVKSVRDERVDIVLEFPVS